MFIREDARIIYYYTYDLNFSILEKKKEKKINVLEKKCFGDIVLVVVSLYLPRLCLDSADSV